MRIYKNEPYIRRRATVGQWIFWMALGTLAVGMFVSFRFPDYPFLPMVALIVGFILAQMGTYHLNRFVRPDRPDVSLTKALKGFSDQYALYHYFTPAAHVLLSPQACYVFIVKLQDGKVLVKEGRGSQPMTVMRLLTFFGRESVGDLTREAQAEVNVLARHIDKHLPDAELTITPVVVFAHPNVELDVQSSEVAVLRAKQLKDWLRGPGKGKGLSAETRQQLVGLFESKGAVETKAEK